MVKNMDWSRISSIDVGVRKLLLAKWIQSLSDWIKKSSLFFFFKLLCLLDLRISFCLKRASNWLEFIIQFSRCSIKSSQRALVGFNYLWIHFTFREFNWVFMSKRPCPLLQMESWASCLGGRFFRFRGNCIFFQFSFWYILE